MQAISKTLSIFSSPEMKETPEKIHGTSLNMISGYSYHACNNVCRDFYVSYCHIHLQATHLKQIISVSRSFVCFLYLLSAGGAHRHPTPRLPGTSICKNLLSFAYNLVHFHPMGWQLCSQYLVQPDNLGFTGRFRLKILTWFWTGEKKYLFVLVEHRFALTAVVDHMLAQGLGISDEIVHLASQKSHEEFPCTVITGG